LNPNVRPWQQGYEAFMAEYKGKSYGTQNLELEPKLESQNPKP